MTKQWVLNDEAIEAWDGPLFDRFVQYRHIVIDGLAPHGTEALVDAAPQPGERVLDVGCGFGDASRQLAQHVGPTGSVVGVDAAPRFIAAAEEENADLPNASFLVADVQLGDLGGPYDLAFSRFGTMFFDNPVAALRNVRSTLTDDGRLCMVVWRRKLDNPWLHAAELIVKPMVPQPDATDEPTCGPGPFSMADADSTAEKLVIAGFGDIRLRRLDLPYVMGRDMDEAIELVLALGPAGEAMRLAGEEGEALRPRIVEALREGLAEYVDADGVPVASASTWVVTARAA